MITFCALKPGTKNTYPGVTKSGMQIEMFLDQDKTNDKVVWKYKNQSIEIKEKEIKSAQIYFEQNILMLIVGQDQGELKLRGYAFNKNSTSGRES